VFTEKTELVEYLSAQNWKNNNLLMMSSGTFDGIDWQALAGKVTG
jgi:UDP-N-acetylmuramate: L-alanyl-gamma-D-glutamyl-meso-diaminopimelate ligase